MVEIKNKELLSDLVSHIEHEMAIIHTDLPKAHKMIAAARRIRVESLRLEKLLKQYRKNSCAYGLK